MRNCLKKKKKISALALCLKPPAAHSFFGLACRVEDGQLQTLSTAVQLLLAIINTADGVKRRRSRLNMWTAGRIQQTGVPAEFVWTGRLRGPLNFLIQTMDRVLRVCLPLQFQNHK